MSSEYVSKTIEAYNASPDKFVNTTEQMVLTPELQTVVDLLPNRTAPLLDAGCAYGRDSAWFTTKGLKTVGIDMSKELLQRARQFYPELEFHEMDVRHLDFPNNYFSGVWCNAVLLHLNDEDVTRAVKEIRRVLMPGGAVCISFKEGQGSGEVAETFTTDKSRFYNFKSMNEVKDILVGNGFSVKKSYILNERERFGKDKRDLNWIYCFGLKEADNG
jgi:SAM-dependent methyltransferase